MQNPQSHILLPQTTKAMMEEKKTHTCETKALLLPISILVYLGAQDLLHQILRIRAMDAPRRGVRPVRHAAAVRRHELRKVGVALQTLNHSVVVFYSPFLAPVTSHFG